MGAFACSHGLQRPYEHVEHFATLGSAQRLVVRVFSRLGYAALKIGNTQLQPAQFIKFCHHDGRRITERWPLGIEQSQPAVCAF